MPMKTFPLEEKCVLLVTPELAAAILIQDAMESGELAMPTGIQEALDAGLTPWQCAKDPGLFELLESEGWTGVSDAFETIQAAGETDTVYCSEFTGKLSVPVEFAAHGGQEIEYDDEYVACLIPQREPDLFKQAYTSPSELIKEYSDRLGDLIGDDVPVGKFVRHISGTYIC